MVLRDQENIPSFSEENGVTTLEFSTSNKKYTGIYKPLVQNDLSFLKEVKIALNLYSKSYDNFFLVGHFNISANNSNVKDFMSSFSLDNLIKQHSLRALNHFHQMYRFNNQ